MGQVVRVFRGLAKDCEEEVNAFLSDHEVKVIDMNQSEFGDHITITLLVEMLDPVREGGS